jgi:CRISPR-associated protein Cmr2
VDNDQLWQTKLHARLHDPAEKALVLLRDPEGHEGGTSRALHRDLGFDQLLVEDWLDPDNAEVLDAVLFKNGIPITMYKHVKRADWWAAGADRPQWPMQEITVTTNAGEQKTVKVADWAQVRWTKQPVLVHPLTGKPFDLKSLADTDIEDIKQRSFEHFSRLIVKDGEAVDWKRTLLAFWRIGPELAEHEDNGKLGHLWPLLPADTRVPDHSIWDHLDLTSTFAGAFAADPNGDAALLAVSLGPVQGFIAAARSTSDLWAGSHLLSRLSWKAMKVVCERLGPDAILFPRLRGVAQVDLWLRDEMKLPEAWFKKAPWTEKNTDANPLFAAALPNRFVAVVPASQAREIAEDVSGHVRGWLKDLGLGVVDRLLEAAHLKDKDQPRDETVHAYAQLRRQIEGFPEVHWAAVPFSLIKPRNEAKQTDLDVTGLLDAMAPFFGVELGKPCGFLDTPAWQALQKEIEWGDGTTFFAPKPGVLYPAVYDLAERVLAATKSVRAFDQSEEKGWRDSLTGEAEWLTHDEDLLAVPAGKRISRKNEKFRDGEHVETLWTKIADEKPALARKGEHLGALSAIKRLWPTLFAEEVARATGQDAGQAARFVVSTHTMALANNLETLHTKLAVPEAAKRLQQHVTEDDKAPALPRALARLRESLAARIPAALERLSESDKPEDEERLKRLESDIKEVLGHKPETYYALVLMDGDHMGRILSGDPEYAIPYRGSFHPQVQKGFAERAAQHDLLKRYGEQNRALSPNRHLAISGALNDFALHVVPEIVEGEHLGRVIYAGGDDVFAMLPVADVLSAIRRLRHAYSGLDPANMDKDWRDLRREKGLICKDGYAYLRGHLLRMMGDRATASCGVVIAHHQAPLAAVRRELDAAEKRAKSTMYRNADGKLTNRNAFSITLIKRSGGISRFTARWGEPLALLLAFRNFLAEPEVSRRAVYNSLVWLAGLPDDADQGMLGSLLAYQLARQTASDTVREKHAVPQLARRLAAAALRHEKADWRRWLEDLLTVAEFLARETHSLEVSTKDARTEEAAR